MGEVLDLERCFLKCLTGYGREFSSFALGVCDSLVYTTVFNERCSFQNKA
jgi:hypothetical protein